jgi:RNA polymerase sigma-70 factor (ECF subfamily)
VKRGERVNQNHSEEQTSDEALLVQRAIGRDAEAFGRLYDMHVDRVYRHIYYRVGNEADAEDLTQQVFLKAWQAIHRYKKTASPFIAWLMTISHNLVIDFYRTRYKRDKAYLEADSMADESVPNPEQETEARFDQQRVRRAILQLPKDQQHVVLLRFVEGFGNAEIASILGKSEGAIRVILHRGLVALRYILEKENGNVEEV